jgi:hypothetical protein
MDFNMTMERDNLDLYLKPTFVIDSDSEMVKEKAVLLTEKVDSQKEKAKALFYFARDEIKYTPYPPHSLKVIVQAKHYKGGRVIVFKRLWL